MTTLLLGGSAPSVTFPPNAPVNAPWRDRDNNAVTLTDMNRNLFIPGGSMVAGTAVVGGILNGVRNGFMIARPTLTELQWDYWTSADFATDIETSGMLFQGEALVGTNSEFRIVATIEATFLSGESVKNAAAGGSDTGVIYTDNGFTGIDWTRVSHIRWGVRQAENYNGNETAFLQHRVRQDGAGDWEITRQASNRDMTCLIALVEWVGPDWNVYRRRMTEADLTYTSLAVPVQIQEAPFDFTQTVTGIPGTVSNPDWNRVFHVQAEHINGVALANPDRPYASLPWEVSPGATGGVISRFDSPAAFGEDFTGTEYDIVVVTNDVVRSEFQSVELGVAWNFPEHDGLPKGIQPGATDPDGDIYEFETLEDEDFFSSVQTLTSENTVNQITAEVWGLRQASPDGVEVFQNNNSPTDEYRVSIFAVDLREMASSGVTSASATVDAWDGEISIQLDPPLAGSVTQVDITGPSGTNVFTAFVTASTSEVVIDLLAAGYSPGGAQQHLAWDELLDVSITDGTDTVQTQVTIPARPGSFRPDDSSAMLIAGGAEDAAPALYEQDTGNAVLAGELMYSSLPVNRFGVFDESITASDVTLAHYDPVNGWGAEVVCTFATPVTLFTEGDAIESLDESAGAFTWPAPWAEPDGNLTYTSDGDCITPVAPPFAADRIVYTSPVLNDTLKWSEVLLKTISPNDDFGPALYTSANEGYVVTMANSGAVPAGEVDRLDLQSVDAGGLLTGLSTYVSPIALVAPIRLRIQRSEITNEISVWLDQAQVLSVTNSAHDADLGGVYVAPLNVNGTCLDEFQVKGTAALAISALNGSAGIPDLVDGAPLVIDWTNTNNAVSFTITDDRGNIATQTPTATDADTDTIAALNLSGLRYGSNLVLESDTGEQAFVNYPVPAGFQFVNLDAVGPLAQPATVTAWPLDAQVLLPTLTDQANAITLSSFGNMTAAGGFWQSVDIQVHTDQGVTDGAGYGAAEKEYLFRRIDQGTNTTPPATSHNNATAYTLDLSTVFHPGDPRPTVTLPTTVSGSSGVLMISQTGGPAGTTITGLGTATPTLTVPMGTAVGTYSIAIQVTDPAGNTRTETLPLTITMTAAVTPPIIISSSVPAISPTTISLTVDATSNSGSNSVVVYAIAVPVGSPQATAAQIRLGQDSTNSPVPSNSVSGSNGSNSLLISGLTTDTIAYEIQFTVEGSTGLLSTAATLDNGGAGYQTIPNTGGHSRSKRARGQALRRPSDRKRNAGRGQR